MKVLGTGGMGVVFQAEDPHLKRLIALKVMKPVLAASAEARQRFMREGRLMAAIKHDHIVTIYQVGQERDMPFMAMEFLEGEALDARLKREEKEEAGPLLPIPEVLRIGREIADALSAAHERGLIHRDIKPANIWLEGKRSRVKILDFGLARTLGEDDRLTQFGAVLGTPAYMSPEQANGEAIDHRCDLFSLGCVLYQLSTGRMPFQGANNLAVLAALAQHTPRPVREFSPSVPPAMAELIMRLLAKDRETRPESAQAVIQAMEMSEREQAMALPKEGASPDSGALSGPASPSHDEAEQEASRFRSAEAMARLRAETLRERLLEDASRSKPVESGGRPAPTRVTRTDLHSRRRWHMFARRRAIVVSVGLLLLVSSVGIFYVNRAVKDNSDQLARMDLQSRPTSEAVPEFHPREEMLRRSLNDPPLTEIWSGKALNELLAKIQKLQGKQVKGPPVELDQEMLKRIHVKSGKEGGNIGPLMDVYEGRSLSWPPALLKLQPPDDRERTETLTRDAVQEAVNGSVDAAKIRDLDASSRKLRELLQRHVGDVPPGDYIEAKRFLNNYDEALFALSQPGAGRYVTTKFSAQSRTVDELVKHMTSQGLLFAPAANGDENAYLALQRAMGAYYTEAQVPESIAAPAPDR
jgi:serine/threonine protein kinase